MLNINKEPLFMITTFKLAPIKCIGLILLLLIGNNSIKAQEDLDSTTIDDYANDVFSTYPFLDETKNELFLPNKSALDPFFKKLYDLERESKEQVHILHIGDSHIQADYFTGQVRRLFQDDLRFHLASRGFVFPYRAAKTNNPLDYKVRYSGKWDGLKSSIRRENSHWGVSGINAITYTENSSITVNPNPNDEGLDIEKVKVFYPVFDPKSFQVRVMLDSGNVLLSSIQGDGYVEFSFLIPQHSVTIVVEKTAPTQNRFLLQGMLLENSEPGIVYSAAGVNGAEVATFARCEDFNKQVAQISPDLVVISLGTNDAYPTGFDSKVFKDGYNEMIKGIRKYLPNVPIIITTPGDNYRSRRRPNRNNEKAIVEMMLMAQEHNLAVWDFFSAMGGFKSIKSWRENNLCAGDMLHLSQTGYELQGELFFQALDMSYEQFSRDYQPK